jgi:hypothetical protein
MWKKAAAVSTIAISRVDPRRHAAFDFELVHNFGDHANMLGAIDFGQCQCQHARADYRLDVAQALPRRPVDADHDIRTAARHDLGRLRDQGARPCLLGGSHTVFEIEDNRVGAAPSTKRLAVTGTNSSERHTGSASRPSKARPDGVRRSEASLGAEAVTAHLRRGR